MDWLSTLAAGFIALLLVAPLLTLLATLFVLAPLAHLAPAPPMLARSTFECPISKRRVNATFLTTPTAERPTDVLECSAFSDGTIRCTKGCLELAVTGWAPSPVAPRYALIAGGTSYR